VIGVEAVPRTEHEGEHREAADSMITGVGDSIFSSPRAYQCIQTATAVV
jgi:hypothetical protein